MNLTTKLPIATLLLSSSCHAFAPNNNVASTSTTSLYAKSLEGWKIDGVIKPVNNFILIQKAEEQTKSDSGILFSNSVSSLLYLLLFGTNNNEIIFLCILDTFLYWTYNAVFHECK
jgi:hypothetical protein